MTRKSEPEGMPPQTIGRRGFGRSFDPFYGFERVARDDGKPYQSPEPKAERLLLSFLGTNAAVTAMMCLLVVVVGTLLVLLVLKV
jgi:hypothetical protein